ncbi:MAG: CDP-alcohol phosphatidyltransferase family protein [Phycisphaerales bacterium]|nr:CDP-alcohol phosphatidyltransferase family protein [Phycisphaerales bacterium]MCI0676260.1 CDP-alcohol phosphatidyltransferase family protein [Phycisphaerales bacterium]
MVEQQQTKAIEARTTRWGTAPNAISAARLVAAAVMPFVEERWWLSILIAGALSDWLDGLLAKRLNARSTMGQILDPIADKALFLSALLTLAMAHRIEWWQMGLIMLRDAAVLVVALFAGLWRRDWRSFKRMKPLIIGKATTVLVFAWLLSVLVHAPWVEAMRMPLFVMTAVSSAMAAGAYLQRFVFALIEERRQVG